MTKIEQIKELLLALDSTIPLIEEVRDDGSTWLIGPYPSFVFMFNLPGGALDGYIVSVNADGPNLVYFMKGVFAKFPDLEHYGPYCEDEENQTIVGGPEAYKLKEDALLRTAATIYKRRQAEKEKDKATKIILPDQKIVTKG